MASLKTAAAFRQHLIRSNISLQLDDTIQPTGALAQPIEVDGVRVGNRFCILPMEGWDGTPSGEPSDLTRRRWRRFGTSGAKLRAEGPGLVVATHPSLGTFCWHVGRDPAGDRLGERGLFTVVARADVSHADGSVESGMKKVPAQERSTT